MIRNTLGAIAKEYGIDRRTLIKMIQPVWPKIKHGQERRKILTNREKEIIYNHLGKPDHLLNK